LVFLAAATAAAFLFVQHRFPNILAAPAAATLAPNARGAQAAAPGTKSSTVIDLDALTPSVTPSVAAASGTATGSARSQRAAGSLRRAPPAAAARPSASPRKHDDEVDVGY
jgi:hypothetical protein